MLLALKTPRTESRGDPLLYAPCQAQGNTLDLWAAHQRLAIGPAAKHLAHAFAPVLTPTAPPATEKWNP